MELSMNVETIAKYKALHEAYTSGNPALVDLILSKKLTDANGDALTGLPLKRIQFDAWEGLSKELEEVCSLLDVSKREFCEAAIVEAIDKAKRQFFESYREATGRDFGESVERHQEAN
jgi:hypothetical protein